jgi:hypothetical protein
VVGDVSTETISAPRVRRWLAAGAAGLGFAAAGGLVGHALAHVAGDRMAPWILGRATGVTAYLLLWVAVLAGLLLSSPARSRLGGSSVRRMRLHISLVLLAAGFTVFHVVVLATDRFAGVGWAGALFPLGAQYRPIGVTLGLLGAWLALLAGGSAAAAGRLPRRLWWPLHKAAVVALALVWVHGVLTGADTRPLRGLYLVTGGVLVGAFLWRHNARSPRVRVRS